MNPNITDDTISAKVGSQREHTFLVECAMASAHRYCITYQPDTTRNFASHFVSFPEFCSIFYLSFRVNPNLRIEKQIIKFTNFSIELHMPTMYY